MMSVFCNNDMRQMSVKKGVDHFVYVPITISFVIACVIYIKNLEFG